MDDIDKRDAMAEACIKAGELVMRHGSAKLQAVTRVMLWVLGQELADRVSKTDGKQARSGREH